MINLCLRRTLTSFSRFHGAIALAVSVFAIFPTVGASAQNSGSELVLPREWRGDIPKTSHVTEKFNDNGEIVRDPDSKLVAKYSGNFVVAGATDSKQAAEKFLKDHSSEMGLTDDLSDIRYVRTLEIKKGRRLYQYEKLHDGIPFFGNTLEVATVGDNTILWASHTPIRAVNVPSSKLDPKAALATIKQKFQDGVKQKLEFTDADPSPAYGLLVNNGAVRPAWKATFLVHPPTNDAGDMWTVYLDDQNGEIIRVGRDTKN